MSEIEARDDIETANPVPELDDVSRISELLAGDSPEQPDSGGDDPPEDERQQEQDLETDAPDLTAAADDDDPPKIDYDLEIPMPDGAESVTLGQLKDNYQARLDHEKERETWEDHRIAEDGRLQVARAELNELAALMGQVNPEIATHLRQQRLANQKQEQEKLLALYPEWADPEVKKAANPAILAAAKHLGLSEQEYAQIGDHRLIHGLKLLSTYMARAEQAKAQLEAAKPLPKGQKSVNRKQSTAQKHAQAHDRAKRSKNQSEKLRHISNLIGA
jgi:hypothetical protein